MTTRTLPVPRLAGSAGEAALRAAVDLAESGRLPDWLLRAGIRRFAADRLRTEAGRDDGQRALLQELRRSPIALHVDLANQQHYELPPAFFEAVLGRHLKYSCAYWDETTPDLDAAESAMLERYERRAELRDGQRVLELGCGWGSLTLWLAARHPRSRIVGVSNSRPQADHIRAAAARRGLGNIEVVTADMNDFDPGARFDRVVSIEMFEHMRNYERLLARVASWLNDTGTLFVHIFTHRTYAYPFETAGAGDWMARYFFTGGLMPSHDLLAHFQRDLLLEDQWWLDGRHYQRTADAWLANLDARADQLRPLFASVYGADAARWLVRWRLFFLGCAEVFGYRGGREWGVSHYRFVRR